MTINEILMLVGGIGGALGFKQLYPIISNWFKYRSEENKLKIKLGTSNTNEIVEMLKQQVDELKEELKIKDVQTIEERNKFMEKIMDLEITLATLRERYKDNALHSRGKKKEENK